MNLIKEAQDLKNKGRIADALKQLEDSLKKPDLYMDLDESVKRELQNKMLGCKADLLKWDSIAQDLSQ